MNFALNCLKESIKIEPDNYDYNLHLGVLLEYSGNISQAKKNL